MYGFTRHPILTGALGFAMLLGTGGQAPARVSSVNETAMEIADAEQDRPHGTQSGSRDGYSCSCVETYMHGREASVWSCDNTANRCADLDVLLDCEEDPDGPDCDYLRQCECDCTALEETVEFEPYDDVVLTGVPDLWQFPFMCGDNQVSANAVGCGPVSAAMVMYWWAQRGFDNLVDRFLVGDGSGPADREHDWQALVRELRANYLDGGICVPSLNGNPQYATLMDKMESGIREYIQDAGYNNVDVDHWKVCEDCNAGEADEILGGDALALIKDELEAGRPVIMGFNVGKAQEVRVPIYHDDLTYDMVYTGELSNGAPIAGIINHYAVITGYRRLGGLDVLSLNLGWNDGTTDQLFAWNPGGKWMHLYTVDITSHPDGTPWCTIDRGVDENRTPPTAAAFSQPYIEISHVETSTPSSTNELAVLAGTSCGIAREGEWVSWYDTTYQLETCVTAGDLPTEEEMADVVGGQTTTTGTRDEGGLTGGGGFPILDQELPLP